MDVARTLSQLNLAPLKEVILLDLRTVRTLKAADEEHRHADRHHHGEHARIRHEPMT